MGKKWDYDVPQVEVWKECLRVLKPGGHALVACGTRTQHRMAVNLEDGGFEIRDLIFYHYGSGFPKSHNIEKSLKKMGEVSKAEEYKGFGTALKPSTEIWTLCRKPLEEKTIASNVLKYGTGGINIEKCRVGTGGGTHCNNRDENGKCLGHKDNNGKFSETIHADISKIDGRFPANLIHDGSDEVVEGFPAKAGGSGGAYKKQNIKFCGIKKGGNTPSGYKDKGSASRYFKECKFTNKELVDLNNSFMYNESILNNNKKICGHILENQKADIILVGVIKEAEKLTQNVEQFLCGKKSMENIQKDIVSIIKIVTKQMIELRTLLVLPLQSITIFTEESEKTIKLLKELNTENVRNVKNIKLLITFKNEVQELIKDTVKNVVEQNLKNGEKRIGKNTTPTTENIASRIKYCAKASKSERNKGCEEIFVLKEKIPEDDLNEIKHLLSI